MREAIYFSHLLSNGLSEVAARLQDPIGFHKMRREI